MNLLKTEFLMANGLGGTCYSSCASLNTSRYHSVLSVSLNPPVDRYNLVSTLFEEIEAGGACEYLNSYQTVNELYDRSERIKSFSFNGIARWIYDNGLTKTMFMVHENNTTCVIYKNTSSQDINLSVNPAFAGRDIHRNILSGQTPPEVSCSDEYATVKFVNCVLKIITNGEIKPFIHTVCNAFYEQEDARGLHSYEDLFILLKIFRKLAPGDTLKLTFTTEENAPVVVDMALKLEEERLSSLSQGCTPDEALLTIAADTFLVRRKNTDSLTIIAGYPWFTDWGRDTMIALEGILLVTGRFNEARQVLQTFLANVRNGLIPNVFDDYTGKPGGYNTIDATFWLFHAMYRYYLYSGDETFIKEVWPVLESIIQSHINGTDYNIRVMDNGLVAGGSGETQLTWMDARVENWTVTPRHGMPVEINALWFNALNIARKFSSILGLSFKWDMLVGKVRNSFLTCFQNKELGCLYDYLTESGPDASVRPNQQFALSLDFPVMEGVDCSGIAEILESKLYTPLGIRTLSFDDPRYIGYYRGDRWSRDGAYHQGTAWPWLVGHYADAIDWTGKYGTGAEFRMQLAEPFLSKARNEWGKTIPEIVDGNKPHKACGCFSQAWSVAELLRLIKGKNRS